MFFKKKKEEAVEKAEKKELLYRENIRVNCEPASKEQVIRTVGQMLCGPAVCRCDGGKREELFDLYGQRPCASAWRGSGEKRSEGIRNRSDDISERD